MRKLIISLYFIVCSFFSYSQNIGIGTSTPHASAALEIQDTSKGILIPRMTMLQRNAIANPAEGLMVYQVDSVKGFWYFSSNKWKNILSSELVSDGDTAIWKIYNNNVYYSTGKVGIGVSTPSASLDVTSYNINQPSFVANGYVTDNLGDPAVGTIRGMADGGAIFEVSKSPGGSRNWGLIRIGVDGNLANIFGVNGNIGINIQPQRRLHISDVMRIEPTSAAPLNPSKGDIYFDNNVNKLRVYDGTIWQNCW
jgi:hypothetical protein